MECNILLQNVTECRYLIRKILQNVEAEITECDEMTYKQI